MFIGKMQCMYSVLPDSSLRVSVGELLLLGCPKVIRNSLGCCKTPRFSDLSVFFMPLEN